MLLHFISGKFKKKEDENVRRKLIKEIYNKFNQV